MKHRLAIYHLETEAKKNGRYALLYNTLGIFVIAFGYFLPFINPDKEPVDSEMFYALGVLILSLSFLLAYASFYQMKESKIYEYKVRIIRYVERGKEKDEL